MITIARLLSEDKYKYILDYVKNADFIDGKFTAGRTAQQVKNNLQLDLFTHIDFIKFLTNEITQNYDVRQYTKLAKNTEVLVSKYENGMEYKDHYDNPIINGVYTDFSFTYFITDDYEGGELELLESKQSIKLPANHLVVYPTGQQHRVNKIISGERIVAVGWIQSKSKK